jgi:hypothetical protein
VEERGRRAWVWAAVGVARRCVGGAGVYRLALCVRGSVKGVLILALEGALSGVEGTGGAL